MRNASRKAIFALVLPLVVAVAAYAGGADCDHGKTQAAGMGSHCKLDKNVVQSAKMTDDGAVVTLKGKNEQAVAHIKNHLTAHEKGERCEGCPLAKDGITTNVAMTDEGGTITVHANSPELVKAVQEWASKPHGACCGNEKSTKA